MAASHAVSPAEAATPTSVLELPVADEIPGYNRRTLPRVAGRFRVVPMDGGPSFEGIDLSFGGLMCTATCPVWPGNCLQVQLRLQGMDEPVRIEATVVDLVSHQGRVAMRMRFDNVDHADRKAIARWMAAEAG